MTEQFVSTVTAAVSIILAVAGDLYFAAAVGFTWVLYNLLAVLSEFKAIERRWPNDRDRLELVRWLTVVGFVIFMVFRVFGVAL